MKRRFLHLALAISVMVSMFAGMTLSGAAQNGSPFPAFDEYENYGSYLPWVPNGVALEGTDSFYGDVTVQNLESVAVEVDIYVGLGQQYDDEPMDWDLAETIRLSANESQTLSASTLGIPDGEGASVKMLGQFIEFPFDLTSVIGFDDLTDEELDEFDEFVDTLPARIAGQVKNVNPVPANNGATNENHGTVDGYSGLTSLQVWDESVLGDINGEGGHQGTYVLPIAQNNSGWETTIRIAHFGDYDDFNDSLVNVTATLYGSGGQGTAGQSEVVNLQIRPGGVVSFDLSDHVEDDWVGSVFISSSAPIGAIAERSKADEQMLVTNTSRPENFESDVQYAPLVFKEYNYWNTGISVANTDPENWNSVTVTYYGPTMNQVGQDTLSIPPRGMEYVYTPGGQDLGLDEGFVGSARISGTAPFHAAVDQVKYFGDDPDVGQAMSYIVEDRLATYFDFDLSGPIDETQFGFGDLMALPLAQKGNPITGEGDTSGIQLFNTSATNSVQAEVTFYGANGNPVAPTVDNNEKNPMLVTLGANQSYTIYTHGLSELSAGFQGSAIVEVAGGGGGIVGVSNGVNYDVSSDGAAAYNLVTTFPIWEIINELIIEQLCETGGISGALIECSI